MALCVLVAPLLYLSPEPGSGMCARMRRLDEGKCGGPWRNVEVLFWEELAFVSALIRKVPHNESGWSYARGLCTCFGPRWRAHPGARAEGLRALLRGK